MNKSIGLAIAAVAAAPLLAATAPFVFSPQPRWSEEPETETVCAAIRAECPGLLKDGEIEALWGYAEVYDAAGMLVGLRSTQSTGCRPLDEHMLLGQRKFRTTFTEAGKPDLDTVRVELAPGTPADSVRLVRNGSTNLSLGC